MEESKNKGWKTAVRSAAADLPVDVNFDAWEQMAVALDREDAYQAKRTKWIATFYKTLGIGILVFLVWRGFRDDRLRDKEAIPAPAFKFESPVQEKSLPNTNPKHEFTFPTKPTEQLLDSKKSSGEDLKVKMPEIVAPAAPVETDSTTEAPYIFW